MRLPGILIGCALAAAAIGGACVYGCLSLELPFRLLPALCAGMFIYLLVRWCRRPAERHALLAQLVFLVGFSYAFFWTGYTGLTITACAILTLFVIMQATGKVNWNEVFKARDRKWSPFAPERSQESGNLIPPPLPT